MSRKQPTDSVEPAQPVVPAQAGEAAAEAATVVVPAEEVAAGEAAAAPPSSVEGAAAAVAPSPADEAGATEAGLTSPEATPSATTVTTPVTAAPATTEITATTAETSAAEEDDTAVSVSPPSEAAHREAPEAPSPQPQRSASSSSASPSSSPSASPSSSPSASPSSSSSASPPSSSSASSPASPSRKRAADDDLDDARIADELDGGRRLRLRRLAVLISAGLLLVLVVTLALLGRANGQRFVLVCGTDRVTPMQGRSFPPWGERALGGLPWKPVVIPPAAECRDREASSEAELSSWFLGLLVEQATARLTARKVVEIDVAAAQLEQALLLARAPERREQRRDIDRLLGDVEYWRAVDKLRAASESLDAAARQFEEAALKQPKHVTDAPARAAQLRRLLEELAGRISVPVGAPATPGPATEAPATTSEPPTIPTVPVLPAADAGPATAPVDAGAVTAPVDAGPVAPTPADAAPIPADAAPAAPDASAGGVLL